MDIQEMKEIAKNYECSAILNELKELEESLTYTVAFLGRFSSAKTTILNMLFDLDMPVGLLATTKTVSLITVDKSLSEPVYSVLDKNGSAKIVSKEEIYALLKADCAKTICIDVPMPKENDIPDGIMFVDTPGANSIGEEFKQTRDYVTSVDCAVLCEPLSNGTLQNDNFSTFLKKELRPIIEDNIICLLTRADKEKDEEARSRVTDEFRKQLVDVFGESIRDRIISVSRRDPDYRERIVQLLNKEFFSNALNLNKHNQSTKLKKIACRLIDNLSYYRDQISTLRPSYEEHWNTIHERQAALEKEEAAFANRLNQAQPALTQALLADYDAFVGQYQQAGEDRAMRETALSNASAAMYQSIVEWGNSLTLNIPSDVNLSVLGILRRCDSEVRNAESNAIKVGWVAEIIGDVAMAVTTFGTSAAVQVGAKGVGKGGVIAMAKIGGKKAAKAGSKAAAKKVAKAASKTIAKAGSKAVAKAGSKAVAKAGGKALFAKGLDFLGKIASPLASLSEHIGRQYGLNVLENNRTLIPTMAATITDLVRESCECTHLQPQKDAYEEAKRCLEKAKRDYQDEKNNKDSLKFKAGEAIRRLQSAFPKETC